MAEIKTSPVQAVHAPALEDAKRGSRIAGSFSVDEPDADGDRTLCYCCPCGCENLGYLMVGVNRKPAASPSWNWNGSIDAPTLTPSVHHVGHWHGWLTDGVWKSC